MESCIDLAKLCMSNLGIMNVKKSEVEKAVAGVIPGSSKSEKEYTIQLALKGDQLVKQVLEKHLRQQGIQGFEYSTLSGLSWGMDDLQVPKEKPALMEKAEKEVEKIESHFEKGFL